MLNPYPIYYISIVWYVFEMAFDKLLMNFRNAYWCFRWLKFSTYQIESTKVRLKPIVIGQFLLQSGIKNSHILEIPLILQEKRGKIYSKSHFINRKTLSLFMFFRQGRLILSLVRYLCTYANRFFIFSKHT